MNKLLHQSKLFLRRNSSTILTCIGGVGVVVTSVMAVKATPKALKRLEMAEEEKGEQLTKMEAVVVAAPVYIPSIVMGASTIACIVGANLLSKRNQAAVISAYALLENSYKEYRNKVEELYGEEARDEVRNEIAKDRYEKVDIPVDEDKRLFYDEFTGQYFESTLEKVLRAEYNVNRDIHLQGFATLFDYYSYLDIDDYDDGGILGWSEGGNMARYWQGWVDFGHTKVQLDDGLECIIITMWSEPYMEFENE